VTDERAKAERGRRYAILAEGRFSPMGSKTANGLIRFRPDEAVAVIDSTRAGRRVPEVLGYGPDIPVVASLGDALRHEPSALLIGIAPTGGDFPDEWRPIVLGACAARLDIVSGLHTFLGRDPEIAAAACAAGVTVWDLREYPPTSGVARGRWREVEATVVLTIGTDARCGKMSTGIEIERALVAMGHRATFLATGQTGIVIANRGIPVDAIRGDFLAGAVEHEVLEADRTSDIVVVEGQGSILHQGFSAVSMGLLHGAAPDLMVLCHQTSRRENDYGDPIGDLRRAIRIHEEALTFKRGRVVAVSLLTADLGEQEAREAVAAARAETGLPATDPFRFGVRPVVDAVLAGVARVAAARGARAGREVS
jgi:uncharacterized NAD-dependent epimerase/dehydratase family protein